MSIKKSAGILLAGCLLSGGCVTRSLTIKTNPAEALVYVNDQLKGKTPLTYDFTWYGWHRVMIRKEGFQRVDDRKMLRAPVYLWIPLDLVMELLPLRIHDNRVWEYTLTPQTEQIPLPPQMFKKSSSLSEYSVKVKPIEQVNTDAAAAKAPEPATEAPAAPMEQQPSASVDVKAEVKSASPEAASEPEAPPANKEWVK